MFVAAAYLIEQLREFCRRNDSMIKMRAALCELAAQYPMQNQICARFVFALLSSPCFNEVWPLADRFGILVAADQEFPLSMLHFLSLDFADGKILPAKFATDENTVARITKDGIFVVSGDAREIAEDICGKLGIFPFLLPVYTADQLPSIPNHDASFPAWTAEWEVTRGVLLEQNRAKVSQQR
jgi:hypothetical protein